MTTEFRVLKFKNGTKILQYRNVSISKPYDKVISTGTIHNATDVNYTDWKDVPIIDAHEPEESNI